jgi:hypothetical protein
MLKTTTLSGIQNFLLTLNNFYIYVPQKKGRLVQVWSVYCPTYWDTKAFKIMSNCTFPYVGRKIHLIYIHDLYVVNLFHTLKKEEKPEADKTLAIAVQYNIHIFQLWYFVLKNYYYFRPNDKNQKFLHTSPGLVRIYQLKYKWTVPMFPYVDNKTRLSR